MKIKGYFRCSPKAIKNPKGYGLIYEKKPCKYKIPIYDLKKARNEPFPHCMCGGLTALYDIELNRELNKIFGKTK